MLLISSVSILSALRIMMVNHKVKCFSFELKMQRRLLLDLFKLPTLCWRVLDHWKCVFNSHDLTGTFWMKQLLCQLLTILPRSTFLLELHLQVLIAVVPYVHVGIDFVYVVCGIMMRLHSVVSTHHNCNFLL